MVLPPHPEEGVAMMDLSDRLLPNQSPEPTGIVAFFLFALDFISSDATHCRWLSFFR